jgi:hypothetical protein
MYFVLEIQINETGSILPYAFDNRADAEAKYHAILSVAAKSTVPKHSAVLMAENGITLKQESYFHEVEETNE